MEALFYSHSICFHLNHFTCELRDTDFFKKIKILHKSQSFLL